MQIKNCVSFDAHDVFLVPNTENTYMLYAPTLRQLLNLKIHGGNANIL